jgi:hypothetical protein
LVNDPVLVSSLLELGLGHRSRAQMSLTERLLTELAAMLRADKKQIPEEP